jgi:hypothetical protein
MNGWDPSPIPIMMGTMGWRRQDLTQEMIRCMSASDQARYGGQPGIHPPYAEDPHPPVNTGEAEKVMQRNFAAECINRRWRPVWHGMHKRSTANRGCPDFIVGARGHTFWIEFKKPGEDLSPDQATFKIELGQNGIPMYTCFSADEAVQVIEQWVPNTP